MLLLVLQGSTNGEQTKEKKKKQTDMFFSSWTLKLQ